MKLLEKIRRLPSKYTKYHPLRSVGYAMDGVLIGISRESSIRFQLIVGISLLLLAVSTGHLLLGMSNLILMSLVVSLEMINTAIELICDLIEPKTNPSVKIIKDLAAGAVLVLALTWGLAILYLLASIFRLV